MANAAGINPPDRRIISVAAETWQRVIDTNLAGAFHCTQSVLPHMRAQGGGTIIHIASVSGKWGDNSGAVYQASKHGMVGLAYGTMLEERHHGLRVTLLFPGLCDTPIVRLRKVNPFTQEQLDQMIKPEDIAAGCVFVASLPARTYVPELIMMPGGLQCIGQAAL